MCCWPRPGFLTGFRICGSVKPREPVDHQRGSHDQALQADDITPKPGQIVLEIDRNENSSAQYQNTAPDGGTPGRAPAEVLIAEGGIVDRRQRLSVLSFVVVDLATQFRMFRC